jgi:hypothetical protein
MSSSRRLASLHEAAHAYMTEHLGGRVTLVRVGRWGGRTRSRDLPGGGVAVAACLWAGVCGEALDPAGPQSPSSWSVQPDRVELARLRPADSGAGYERAVATICGSPEATTAVLALADVLARRRLLLGWQVRAIIANPSRYPPRPRRRRGGPPSSDYIRRSIG